MLDRRLVHLWLLDLDTPVGFRGPLGSDELDRVRRLKDDVLQRRTARRFALSRLVLAGILDVPPTSVAFVRGACGKPRVVPSRGRLVPEGQVGFNLSHSGNVLAIAVGFGVETGVDVEVIDHGMGTADFYRDWTVQEAVSKLVGTGIALRGRAPIPSPPALKSFTESVGGKEVILALAVSEPRALPDLHQRVFAEDPALL